MASLIPFWVNAPQAVLDRLDARWKNRNAQAQLRNPWQVVKLGLPQAGAKSSVLVYPLPGLCEIDVIEQKLTVQNNKKSGGDGGRPTIRGRENPDLVVHMELHAPFQWIAWQQLKPQLRVVEHPTERDEVYVEHPLAAAGGINWCVVIGLKQHKPISGGAMKVEIKLLGCSEKKGGTKVPKKGAVNTAPETVPLPAAQQSPNLVEAVTPGAQFE